MTDNALTTPETAHPSVILRAAFLAASWTWCIGMWLPVLLIGDGGWAAWVMFATPNVIGAMSVGFVLSSERARAFATRHAFMSRWFSVVTVLFHVSFLSWMSAWAFALIGYAWLGPVVALIALLVATVLARAPSRAWGPLALLTLTISVACLLFAGLTGLGRAIALPPGPPLGVEAIDTLWLAPVLAFGFLTCPFLDLTILRTRAETPGRRGHIAFALGFGVFFLAMIVGTLLYADAFVANRRLSYWIIAHFFAQAIFTMGAHMRELNEVGYVLPARAQSERFRRNASGAMFVALATLAISTSPARLEGWDRTLYDLLLSPYALVFPAYVWIVCVPRSRAGRPVVTFVVASALATPMLWMGAIEREWPWLAPAVALPLLAPLLVRVFADFRGTKTPAPAP